MEPPSPLSDALPGPWKHTRGGWVTRCPAHDDKRCSLSVTVGRTHHLLKCHAGCTFDDILAAAGLSKRQLVLNPKERGGSRIVATYPYTDEAGTVLYEVVRMDPKDFRQRRPNGDGDWAWDMQGITRVPFMLPELHKAIARGKIVFIVEGEKDVLSLKRVGLTATCNAGGAGKWEQSWASYFQGALVGIIPDNDIPGRRHALQVAQSIEDSALMVKLVGLRGLRAKEDVSDWLANGHTADELRKLWVSAPALKRRPQSSSVRGRMRSLCERILVECDNPYIDDAELVTKAATAIGKVLGKPSD